MKDINKIINSLKGSNSEEALDKVAKMVKNGESGMSVQQAISIINQLSPYLDRQQQENLRKLVKKLRS